MRGAVARCSSVNSAWLAFIGRSFEQEVAENWGVGVHPDDAMARDVIHRESFERRRPFAVEYRLRRSDGIHRFLDERGAPYTDSEGAFAGFIGSCVEADDRRAHDPAGSDFFAISLDPLCVAGFDGSFKHVNGTTFHVTLPSAPPAIVAGAGAEGPANAPRTRGARGAILVVDDEPGVGMVLRRLLRDHEVTVVTMATEALSLLAAGRHFDVILSDVAMPATSGMAFYDELTRRFPGVADRVIFVSGGSVTLESRAFFERVSSTRIDKPFESVHVERLVIEGHARESARREEWLPASGGVRSRSRARARVPFVRSFFARTGSAPYPTRDRAARLRRAPSRASRPGTRRGPHAV